MAAPTPVRYLAPIALSVTLIAVLIVLVTFDGNTRREAARSATTGHQVPARRTYVVRVGDTIVSIAARFGLTQEQLIALNPGIDAQALQPGVRLRLR